VARKAERPRKDHSTPEEASRASRLRIIGGKFRGRQIEYSGDARTRPMKDRVREAVFNLVGPRVVGKLAIDLFAGTGAIGLEALSRGATQAIFLERHFPTAAVIRRNAALLGAEDLCTVLPADTFIWARRELPQQSPPWVVFCSPPFEFYASRRDDMLELIARLWDAAPAESVLVVEADEHFDFALLPQPERWDVRPYPPAVVGLVEKFSTYT
jgi:16S rRNA (guanine(966)-N(2))-methyltransferase RsmD